MNNNYYGVYINNLIGQLSKLPGIGGKSAQRLAFYIINLPKEKVAELADCIIMAKNKIKYCELCCNFSDQDICNICSSPKRNNKLIMIVENPKDMAAYEKINIYNGVYHVLHGLISPINNIGPSDLKINKLLARIKNNKPEEIILALNSTVEGEATALYLSNLIKPLDIKITRIAYGIPVGADIQYADEMTLSKALEHRNIF